jgi:GNAT superfamily N-acetyltransferase
MTDIEENNNEPKMNFDAFIKATHLRNAWIYEQDIAIYVRRSMRFINDTTVLCLDLASVEVAEHVQGRGVFTAFLYRFEQEAKKMNRAVFVESILNKRLENFLLKKGYIQHPHSTDICPCLYKLLS